MEGVALMSFELPYSKKITRLFVKSMIQVVETVFENVDCWLPSYAGFTFKGYVIHKV